jgi:predicted nucleic acid-binding protein
MNPVVAGNKLTELVKMIILDTNVLSELSKSSPDTNVRTWFREQNVSELFTTAVNEAEWRYGAANLPEGRRKEELVVAIDAILDAYVSDRILAFDRAAAREYATMMALRRGIGRPMDGHELDCQIAAIARANGAEVATRDVRDFSDCGISVINPWEAAATQ